MNAFFLLWLMSIIYFVLGIAIGTSSGKSIGRITGRSSRSSGYLQAPWGDRFDCEKWQSKVRLLDCSFAFHYRHLLRISTILHSIDYWLTLPAYVGEGDSSVFCRRMLRTRISFFSLPAPPDDSDVSHRRAALSSWWVRAITAFASASLSRVAGALVGKFVGACSLAGNWETAAWRFLFLL